MAKMTPQQIAAAAAKRRATIAANRAAGIPTVRQQRAAARAAKNAGATSTNWKTKTKTTSTPPPTSNVPPAASFGSKAYAAPVPTYRGQKLVALAAFESAFVLKLKEQGITTEARDGYARYQKLKALALGNVTNSATQNEADAALRMAVIHLVKLAF